MCQFPLLFIPGQELVILIFFLVVWPAVFGLGIYYAIKCDKRAKEMITQLVENQGWKLVRIKAKMGPGPYDEMFRRRGFGYYKFDVTDSLGRSAIGWARFDFTLTSTWEPEIIWVETTP
jgi:hypothetical protein